MHKENADAGTRTKQASSTLQGSYVSYIVQRGGSVGWQILKHETPYGEMLWLDLTQTRPDLVRGNTTDVLRLSTDKVTAVFLTDPASIER